ncbi:IS4 family transposase [Streptomyces sp. BE303]|uniref:IS4 family transposase n=1 Tax=Streptomyces sp. BE303 TaxID=3002528 RepID=UPI002E77B788|nr:IS4 family transposase [Streptomyces sp. BE303]MED7949579.1 IS4 family transposase [Streptomyces sp. BE303]
MPSKCATTTLTRTITLASGLFAPGHLGELTQQVPFELVDAILDETLTTQRRLRQLPSRVGVYFLLALALFPTLGNARVWDKLTAGLHQLTPHRPSEKALRDLRRRLGPAPMKALFEVLAGSLAQPRTPGTCYRSWRTVAFDGCSSLKAPDQPRVRALLGKARHRWGIAGYPALQLMALCETGTRGLLGAVFGPTSTGEQAYALKLLPLLSPSMLLLADRGFDGQDFLGAVADTGAKFLVRLRSLRCPAVLAVLPDGSYLTRLGQLKVRIIEADITVTTRDGQRVGDRYRLATTLLDHRSDPAEALVRLYHERWEVESAFYALRHTLLTRRVLRSCDPSGLEQELWALLSLYQILRRAMVEAIESAPGTDPDRASFTVALEAARDQVTTARGVRPPVGDTTSRGAISDAVLAALLPPRRSRVSARKVKSPMTRYPGVPSDPRPATSRNITHLAIIVHQTAMPPAPTPRAPSRRALLLRLLRTDPYRTWQSREIAQGISCSNIRSLWTQLNDWTKEGILHKIARNTYELAPEWIGMDAPADDLTGVSRA